MKTTSSWLLAGLLVFGVSVVIYGQGRGAPPMSPPQRQGQAVPGDQARTRINLEVLRRFHAEGLRFAYPTSMQYAVQVQEG